MYKNAKVSIVSSEAVNCIVLKYEGEKLLIRCRKGHGLQENETINFFIYHPLKGEMSCNGILTKAFSELLIIEQCKIDKVFQLRNETRVELEILVTVKRMFCGPEMKELTRFIPMHTRNLSASGAGFFSKFDMPIQTRLIVDIPLENKMYYIDTFILRKHPLENGYYYGCKFNDLPPQIQSKIRSFVYKKQIDLQKRGKLMENKDT
jgi:hypothetical protein